MLDPLHWKAQAIRFPTRFSEVKVALPRYFSLTKIVSVIVRSVVVFCRRTDPKFTINLTTRFVKLS